MVSTSVKSNGTAQSNGKSKSEYFAPVYEGLLDPKHIQKIGGSLWLFLWCIHRTTTEDDEGVGWVLGRKALTYAGIAEDLGQPVRKIRRWKTTLERGGYITVTHGHEKRMRIGVLRSKKRGLRKVRPPEFISTENGQYENPPEFISTENGQYENSYRPKTVNDSCTRLETKDMIRQKTCALSIRLDASPSDSDGHGKNGKAKATQIADHFRATIDTGTRLTEKAQTKINARLQTYSVDELKGAVEEWKNDRWQMEHNGQRGMAWFFATDDRIEQWKTTPAPEPKPAGPVAPEAAEAEAEALASTNGAAEQPAVRTGSSECMCPNCHCHAPPEADNALCTRCQSGACWKDPMTTERYVKEAEQETGEPESPQQNVPRTDLWAYIRQENTKKPEKTESPQAPIQPHRATKKKPGLKPAYTRVGDIIRQGKAARIASAERSTHGSVGLRSAGTQEKA